jgi:hypothetical protein
MRQPTTNHDGCIMWCAAVLTHQHQPCYQLVDLDDAVDQQPTAYLMYIVVILLVMPRIAFDGKIEPENIARASHLRFQLLLLLFRIGLAVSLATWLQAAFQQGRACFCNLESMYYCNRLHQVVHQSIDRSNMGDSTVMACCVVADRMTWSMPSVSMTYVSDRCLGLGQ